jgi:dihydrofolate synthase/folylpolyglutamate synthase
MKLPFWPNPLGYRDIDLGLTRVLHLLSRLDSPHQKLPPTIHIAGTNGKGSTLAYLKAIFEDAGLKVHRYTSPHLIHFNERILLAGSEISDDFLNELLQQCQTAADIEPKINPTFFEGITVAAFLAFSKINADILLLETGMGGRLDATNVISNPLVTIITPISFDHSEFLGKTLAKIAFEKAGIIKKNCPVVISKQSSSALKILQNIALQNHSKIFYFDQDKDPKLLSGLIGEHQIINYKTAIAAIFAQNKFNISLQNIKNGLQQVVWQARLQKINSGKLWQILPANFEMFLDGGHNVAGAKAVANWLKDCGDNKKNYFICAMLQDKDSKGFLKHLAQYCTMLVGLKITDEEKSKTGQQIAKIASNLNIESFIAEGFIQAIIKIKHYHQNHSSDSARIIICGSLYLAGEFLAKNFR